MNSWQYTGLNRTMCQVLDEMRKLNETRNYSSLLSLIEEVQIMGNRMEAALYYVKDIKTLHEEKSKLKKECEELSKQKEQIDGNKDK